MNGGALSLLGDVVILAAVVLPWVVGFWWAMTPPARQLSALERAVVALERLAGVR